MKTPQPIVVMRQVSDPGEKKGNFVHFQKMPNLGFVPGDVGTALGTVLPSRQALYLSGIALNIKDICLEARQGFS